jgi:hypothetical protein
VLLPHAEIAGLMRIYLSARSLKSRSASRFLGEAMDLQKNQS